MTGQIKLILLLVPVMFHGNLNHSGIITSSHGYNMQMKYKLSCYWTSMCLHFSVAARNTSFLIRFFHYHWDINSNYMSQQALLHCLTLVPRQLQIMTCPQQTGATELQLLYVVTLQSPSGQQVGCECNVRWVWGGYCSSFGLHSVLPNC